MLGKPESPLRALAFGGEFLHTAPMYQGNNLLEDLAWQAATGADEAVGEVAGLTHWPAAALARPQAQTLNQPQSIRFPPSYQEDKKTSSGSFASSPPLHSAHKHMVKTTTLAPIRAESVATTLLELRAELERFEGCALKQTAMNLVFASGNPSSGIMVVGDKPSEDDDRSGLPFSGEVGDLLDKMLAAINLSRESVYLSNIVFWRPPGNRTPTEPEIAACLPFAEQHIALVKPKLLLVLGSQAARILLRTKAPFAQLRGKWIDYTPQLGHSGQEMVRCLPTYHPSFLMHQTQAKRQAWEDLLLFRQEVNETIPLNLKE